MKGKVMAPETLMVGIREAADRLMRFNVEAEPEIVRTYLFPSDEEIRLIHVHEATYENDSNKPISAFHFSADPVHGIPFRSAIGLIRPEEENVLLPPRGWGEWGDAERIYER